MVEDFAAAVTDPDYVSPGTTLDEAIVACRMIDEAYAALVASTTLEFTAPILDYYEH